MAFKFTLSEIANAIGGDVRGDASIEIGGIAGLEEAKRGDIAFLSNPKYEKFLDTTRASAVIVSVKTKTTEGKNFVVVKDPYLAFAKALTLLKPVIRFQQGISAKADIHASVKLGKDVSVGAFAVLEEGSGGGRRLRHISRRLYRKRLHSRRRERHIFERIRKRGSKTRQEGHNPL